MSKLIPIRAKDKSIVAHTVVDNDDFEWLSQWRWHVTKGYVRRNIWIPATRTFQTISMARIICGLERGDSREPDHIDRDRLNNQRSNLRVVTHAQNVQNRPSFKGSASQYRGVTLYRGYWVARVKVDGKMHHLGRFSDEEEAGRVAKEHRERLLAFAGD